MGAVTGPGDRLDIAKATIATHRIEDYMCCKEHDHYCYDNFHCCTSCPDQERSR